MRILMSSSADSFTLAAQYASALKSIYNVHEFIPPSLPARHNNGPISRAIYRVAPHLWWRQSNAQLLSQASQYRPDFIWLFKGADIYPRTLRGLRRMGMTLINYNADHPFSFYARGSGGTNVVSSIREYDLHITYSHKIAAEMKNAYPDLSVAVVPFGHGISEPIYEAISDQAEIVRACFVGNPDAKRIQLLSKLADAGVVVDVYGHYWERYLTPTKELALKGPVLGLDMFRVLRAYRVQLNVLRPHNADSHNMRTFEVPASGGIMLAERTREHEEFFVGGREAYYFGNEEEMIAMTRHLLALDLHQAGEIRERARRRSVISGYSYPDRATAAIVEIKSILQRR